MAVEEVHTNEGPEPAGAIFRRCALQVNPGHYAETFRGEPNSMSAQAYADAVVERAHDNEVSVLAITDHNSTSGVSAFETAADRYGITVFPGFELSSSEGVHVLCLYPSGSTEQELGRHLGHFGIRGVDPSSDLSSKTFTEIIGDVQEQGGIAIAAHINGNRGLMKTLRGKPRALAWKDENLLAAQIPASVDDLDEGDRRIVENKDHAYRRTRLVALINSKDITEPKDLDDPSSNCFIKMSEVTIEGLRQAFLDPESRVRLNSDPPPEDHAELISVSWEGGFLDGITIHFNPNLNVLIGGRGAGKSAVIESLRYVLGLSPTGEEAKALHEEIVKQVLRGGTKISLKVRSHHPIKSEYVVERIVGNSPVVRDSKGEISALVPSNILPNVQVYGQHEISELTRSPGKLTQLLDRFVAQDHALERRESVVQQGLKDTRASILDTRASLDGISERLAELPRMEETITQYQAAGYEDRLQDQTLLVREERVLTSMSESVQPFEESLQSLRNNLPISRAFISPEALEELPGKNILSNANGVLSRFSDRLEKAAQLIEDAILEAKSGVDTINSRWGERKAEVEANFNAILRELGQAAVDGEHFITLKRDIEELLPMRERETALRLQLGDLQTRRQALLVEWEDIKAVKFRQLDSAAKKVSQHLRNHVRVAVRAGGNKEPLIDLLRRQVGGRIGSALDKINQTPELSVPRFVSLCNQGADAIREAFSIQPAQANAISGASQSTLMLIEELELPAATTIDLNVAGPGEEPVWQGLDRLSTGQKSTALLLLLLLDSDAPLVVDQPEDDLDNRFVTEGIVPKMREEKRRRQFVFSSHNANIPVLGDAELILGMTAAGSGDANQGRATISPEHVGSIDAGPVRRLVGQILEGGRAAFEMRRLKYGF